MAAGELRPGRAVLRHRRSASTIDRDRRKGRVRTSCPTARGACPRLAYADLRLEVVEARGASPRTGRAEFAGDDYGLALGVRVLAGARAVAPGYVGLTLGAADVPDLDAPDPRGARARVPPGLGERRDEGGRAREVRRAGRGAGGHPAASRQVREDTVPAVYERDPRSVPLGEMVALHAPISRAGSPRSTPAPPQRVGALTQVRRELFASTEGALIDQSFALTQGVLRGGGRGRRREPGALRRAGPPARLGDPRARRGRAAASLPGLCRVRAGARPRGRRALRVAAAAHLRPRRGGGHRPSLQHAACPTRSSATRWSSTGR